ncbi:conserved unknown protein [Ectocarpus siliculosus]|uniref:Uncharacterized protein n=1 Tax=Ectocarpus siliculosus TaxID=2880 RepID=D7FX21_ECTSI|nr:conserved unknown protein [Ectocarpus siliculosus]|eukprot:CBJ26354.1 conserved unknown protein [Ectocarpus siliculosus]
MARTNTSTPVPHAAEALQTKPPPAAIPQPTKPAAAGVAESAISSRGALEEKVPAGAAGHGEGVWGAAVGESADESSLLGASVLRMLEQARKALGGGGQGGRRLPVEHVREVVAMWEEEEEEEEKGGGLARGRRSTLRGVTSVETVRALFYGWVESDVVDLYHGGSEDVRQTLKQCREAMEQVVANEHAASAAGAWTMYTSPDHDNRPYWHNAQNNETTWENPFEQQQRRLREVQQAQAQPRGAPAAAGGGAEGGAESSSSASTTVSQLAKDIDSMAASWKAGGFNHDRFTSWMGRALRTRSEIRTRREEGKSGGGLPKFSAPVQDSPRGATNDVRGPLAAWPGSSVATREAVQVPQAGAAAAAAAAAAVGEDRREMAGAAAASGGAAARGADGGGAAAGGAVSVARAAVRSSDIPRAATGREQQVPWPAAVETKKVPAVEAAGLKTVGQETAAAAAVAKKPTAAKATEQPPQQQQLLKTGASAGKKEVGAAAAGAVGVATLEAQMADLQAAEERQQAAKAKKAARRAEEAAEREDRETQEAVARKEAAARRREATAAGAARSKAEAAARETARIAEAKAATEARVMAAVAAQAKAEKDAKEAAKKTAKESADLQQANRAKRQERAKAVADAKAANEARAAEKAQREEKEAAAAAAATAAAAAATGPAMRGGGVGGGGALLADMSLEVRLKKAIDSGNTLAVQSIYDEADQTPGASMKKIKKKCQRYLNKKAGEDQKLQQASQPAPVRGAGAGAAAAQAAAAQRPTQHDMFCPNNIAPQLIGKQGQTVNKLMKDSRAKIVVKPYPDRSGNDVIITGTPNAVKTAKRLVEEFYRSKGCQPSALPPPSSAVAARKAEGARARPAQPVTGGPGGGGGGGAAPVVVEDGAWGGELRQLLRVAGCEHHLERFREDQLDGEVLLMMDRRDFERMGVTEGEQIRILNALKGSGGGGMDDDDEDSDGLDPDHPDTCKICLDALVDILFLPCAHQCTCSRCGSAYEGKPCILCRRVVDKVQRVIKLRG